MLKRPEFEISTATQLVLDLMVERLHTENTLITYAELEKLTGMSGDKVRSSIYTARDRVRKDYSRWYANVPKIGYRVVLDEEIHKCAKANRSRARNLHRETLKTLKIADPAKQSLQARTSTILERSIAELGMAATAPRAVAKVEQAIARSHNELNLEQQMAAIKEALTPK